MERFVIRCEYCRDLICVIKNDCNPRTQEINVSMVEQSMGQGPWYAYDEMQCRNCGEPFALQQPRILTEEIEDRYH